MFSLLPHRLWLVTLCLLATGSLARGADAPRLTVEQKQRLAEADALRSQAEALLRDGKTQRGFALGEKGLAIQREVLGNLHADVVATLEWLAGLREQKEDFAGARKVRQEVLAVQTKRLGAGHWQTTDARLALADMEIVAKLSAEQRRRLAKATTQNREAKRLRKQQKYSEAIALGREVLAVRRKLLGDKHTDTIQGMNNLVILLMNAGQTKPAEPVGRQMAAAAKEAYGENHPTYARALNTLGHLHLKLEQNEQAQQALQKSVQILKGLPSSERPDNLRIAYEDGLTTLADLYQKKGKHAAAEPYLREWIDLVRQRAGPRGIEYANAAHDLGVCYHGMADYVRAEKLLREALALRKELLGENHSGCADTLYCLGRVYYDSCQFGPAKEPLQKAMEIYQRTLGEKHPRAIETAKNLVRVCSCLNEFDQAERLACRVRDILRETVGEKDPRYAEALSILANYYKKRGWLSRAAPLYRQVLAIRKAALGEGHPQYITALHDLANLYHGMGDHVQAEAMLRQVVAMGRRAWGEKSASFASALTSHALVLQYLGRYQEAEKLLCEAVAIKRKVYGETHLRFVLELNNLAGLYSTMGRLDQARPLMEQALPTIRKALGEKHEMVGLCWLNLANVYRAQQQYAKAEDLYRRAEAVFEQFPAHPGYAGTLSYRADLYLQQNQPAKALPHIQKSLTLYEGILQDSFKVQGERQRLACLRMHRSILDQYLTIATAAGAPLEEIYRRVLFLKGAVTARLSDERLARDHPELKPLLDRLAAARTRLAQSAFIQLRPEHREAWARDLEKFRREKEECEAELARASAAFRRQQRLDRLGTAEVIRALPPATALVDVIQYAHSSPKKSVEERRLVAFVLRPGRPVALVPMGSAEEVRRDVRWWREAVEISDVPTVDKIGATVSQRFWKPLAPHLEGVKTLLFSPDGALCRAPLAALPGKRSGSYLIEDMAIGQVTSGRHALECLTTAADKTAAQGLLAIGGIDYGSDPGRAAPRNRNAPIDAKTRAGFANLPGTELEARSILALFGQAFPQRRKAILTGAEPTEERMKAELTRPVGQRWRYVHLATHGFFASPSVISALRSRDRQELPVDGLAGQDAPAIGLNPALLSGLVVAGARRAAEGAGILTAEEVASFDLRGTELVVLSACETGLGEVAGGEGVLGLQRAFQLAGARSLMASLWSVDDAATTLLMEEFYRQLWQKKLPKLEALRQAQLFLLAHPERVVQRRKQLQAELAKRGLKLTKSVELPAGGRAGKRSHPALWAAFILSGDGR